MVQNSPSQQDLTGLNLGSTGLVDRNNGDDTADTRQQFIRVKLRKPMGMVLAEKASTVFVEEMTSGGNADKSGKVRVGDVVSK